MFISANSRGRLIDSFIVGMIMVLSGGTDSVYFGPGVSAATVTILYGYIGGYLIEAGLEK